MHSNDELLSDSTRESPDFHKLFEKVRSFKEDKAVQELLYDETSKDIPNIFTHTESQLIQEYIIANAKKTKVKKVVADEVKYYSSLDLLYKEPKHLKKSERTVTKFKMASVAKLGATLRRPYSRVSKALKLGQSRSKPSIDSQGATEIVHIVTIKINRNLQQELKCKIAVDIFIEFPWTIISKTTIMKTLERDKIDSPFYEHTSMLQAYPEEEIIVGRTSIYDYETFLVALTLQGRTTILEELKSAHLKRWDKLMKLFNFPVKEWHSLGSEVEMNKEIIKNSRPFISYDCYINKEYHKKVYKEGFKPIDYYTELIEEGLEMVETVEGVTFPKHVQATPQYQDTYAQTFPEIPVNSSTQFSIEMRVAEHEERLKEMDLDWDLIHTKMNGFLKEVDTLLTYNEEYDLFRDDYEVLALRGEEINLFPNIPYEFYLTLVSFIGGKDKVITGTSWHPNQPGIVAVSYGRQHVAKMENTDYDSNDEEPLQIDSDEECFFNSYQTSNQFDEHVENIWSKQLVELKNSFEDKTCNTEDYDLAIASTEFLRQIKNIRLFEVTQERTRFLSTPDVEDLYHEEEFKYQTFEEAKRKQKQEDKQSIEDLITSVMSEEPTFLKRSHLFSGNFHWKLKFADDVINPVDLLIMKNEGSVPKKFVRTHLFREIWCGDTWNFGEDLKYSVIEVNKDFREPALLSLGVPTIPEYKIFLPGFKYQENDVDYTVELNPWQWIDAWLEHCKQCEKNNVPLPTEEQTCDLPDNTDDETRQGDEEPFEFMFIRNVPVYDIEYEGLNLQYFLCANEECEQCHFFYNNVMTKEGVDHVCLKVIMDKNNPDEVDEIFMVPYEHTHNSFEKKEEKLLLKKKIITKEEEEDINEENVVIDDEYELPFCSSENGCLIRRLLPDYLIDNRNKKLFCDQCQCEDEKSLDENDIVQNKSDTISDDSELKCDSINNGSETSISDISDSLCKVEYEDAVGKCLQGKEICSPSEYLLDEINDSKASPAVELAVVNRSKKSDQMTEYELFQLPETNLDELSSTSDSITYHSAISSTELDKKHNLQLSVPDNKISIKQNIQRGTSRVKYKSTSQKSTDKSHHEKIFLDIKHIIDQPSENLTDFSPETKKIVNEELEKLKTGKRTKMLKRQFEEMSSCHSSNGLNEHSDDEEDLDKLNLLHHVAIWDIGNEIKPMRRLVSPIEITSLNFCPHNGKLIAGGTSTGQVVLWDLTEDKLEPEPYEWRERSDFDILGFKHLERTMCWFKRLRPHQRLYITALSNKTTSHNKKVLDITWLPPNVKISNLGYYEELSENDEFSLQFMSTSADGVLKFWDLTSPLILVPEPQHNLNAFKCPQQFKLPSDLLETKSKYGDLFLRWNPTFQIRLERINSTAERKFHLTCISHDRVFYNYEKTKKDPLKKSLRNVELQEFYKFDSVNTASVNNEALVGTIDGRVILFSWKHDPDTRNMDDRELEEEGKIAKLIRKFEDIHDGPITCISRHPSNNNIFLTTGGRTFALWQIDQVRPLKWKRYTKCFLTTICWTEFRPSSFRIGRSDGFMEIWDLYESGNEAKMVLNVAPGPIYDFTVPHLPVPKGLVGITDSRGVLKFYFIPLDYHEPRPDEEKNFFEKIKVELERKIAMERKSVDYTTKDEVKPKEDENEESDIEIEVKLSQEIIKKKEIFGCKKFKDELYKWYLRRRGKNALWLDEGEKNWFKKEEEYMIKSILQTKQINMEELEKTIAPLHEKEKHETEIAIKILDVLEMADDIFRHNVQELALARDHKNKSQVSFEIEKIKFGDLHDIMEEVELYFGEHYEKVENDLEMFVKCHKIDKEWTFAELCEKNQPIRDFWNDRRRFFNPEYQWARELVEDELEKAGYDFTFYVNHEESYLKKKYKRRLENIEQLKNQFGDDYDPYWDLPDRFSSITKETDGTKQRMGIDSNLQRFDEVYSLQAMKHIPKTKQRQVNVVLPKGSFYTKYMPPEKNVTKSSKDKLGESDLTICSTEPEFAIEAEYEVKDKAEHSAVRESSAATNKSSDSEEKSESSDSVVSESDKNGEEEVIDELRDKSKNAVRFLEPSVQQPQTVDETIKPKKVIDFKKEDITGRYRGLDDLRKIIKEKKMRGEEIIDIDDLSGSFESISGSISSSAPSPDMSIKSEDFYPDPRNLDEDSEFEDEYFKEVYKEINLQEASRCYEPPEIVPYDMSSQITDQTDEWMEEDLKPVVEKKQEEKGDEETEGDVKTKESSNSAVIPEKEKSVEDLME